MIEMWLILVDGTSDTCFPRLNGGEDAFGVGGPDEGFGIGVGLGHEAVDGELQVDDGLEDAALETLACELGEEAFNGVKPGRRGRGVKWKVPARVTGQPSAHPLGCLWVASLSTTAWITFSHRNLRLYRIEEADELLMAVTLHVAADDSAVEDVESRGRTTWWCRGSQHPRRHLSSATTCSVTAIRSWCASTKK